MLYREQNDETLVLLTLAGDKTAYETLVKKYESAVTASAFSVLHSRYLSEDAAQDAFVTAWMKLALLREREKFGAWVCRIAKNVAKNMLRRYNGYVGLDDVDYVVCDSDMSSDPEYAYISFEEKEQLHKSISSLPERVRRTIELHYFCDLSVSEIAAKLGIPEGTVKWQLHDGRKKLRKGLGAMNERIDDTLIEKVMKKVEELKLWGTKNSKVGFENDYREALSMVETLPESEKKQSAMADVLVRGWWWIPGEQNDATLSRIREAAFAGGNEEVIDFILEHDSDKFYGDRNIEYIRDVQIPELEKTNYKIATGKRYMSLARMYYWMERYAESHETYQKALTYLPEGDIDNAFARECRDFVSICESVYDKKDPSRHRVCAFANEIILSGTEDTLRQSNRYLGAGELWSVNNSFSQVYYFASMCDGLFTVHGKKVGETYLGTDGTTLTFESDAETVEAPAGVFPLCELWMTRVENIFCKVYYKAGVGIVKLEMRNGGISEIMLLSSYNIVGGGGVLPLAKGNEWEYVKDISPEYEKHKTVVRVAYIDDKKAVLCGNFATERISYDENDWADMMRRIRSEYYSYDEGIQDVSASITRARELAKTPFEKAWTSAACDAAERILATDLKFNPGGSAAGLWNFFEKSRIILNEDGTLRRADRDHMWSFEWKSIRDSIMVEAPLLYNDIYGIFQGVLEFAWDECLEREGTFEKQIIDCGDTVKCEVTCEKGIGIDVAVGHFDDCIKVTLLINGYGEGWSYRNGKMEYYFAPGIGIVKTVKYIAARTRTAVYELTEYKGTGDGYMPVEDGMVRRYDAIGLTDGYVAYAIYNYAKDEDGQIHIFSDRCGIKNKNIVTEYSSIADEGKEAELWRGGDKDACRALHSVNTFKIFCHMLCRAQWYAGFPETGYSWHTWRIKMIESLGREIPRAWIGTYAHSLFNAGAAAFALGRKEEGYEYLERALEYYPKWIEIPHAEALEVGDDAVWGGVKVKKGVCTMILPDGREEWIGYGHVFAISSGAMYKWMSLYNWGWLDSVRDEERFKKLAERAKEMMK